MNNLYKLVPTRRFIKQLKKIGSLYAEANYKLFTNQCFGRPKTTRKGFVGNRVGQWRYRIGNYRVIVQIVDNELVIATLEVGHRRDIY